VKEKKLDSSRIINRLSCVFKIYKSADLVFRVPHKMLSVQTVPAIPRHELKPDVGIMLISVRTFNTRLLIKEVPGNLVKVEI
jgi:hypothetical protein